MVVDMLWLVYLCFPPDKTYQRVNPYPYSLLLDQRSISESIFNPYRLHNLPAMNPALGIINSA